MFRIRAAALVLTWLAALVVVAGCESAPTHDSVMESTVSAMEEMVAVCRTVQDEASANAAKPKLQALSGRLKGLREQADQLGKTSADKDAAIKTKYEARLLKAMGEFGEEAGRIGRDPKLNTALTDLDTSGTK